MIVLYIILGILAVLAFLLLVAVIRTCLTPSKTSEWEPKKDPAREQEYAEKLAKMVRFPTVSYKGQIQREKFLEFHKILEELFPLVHSHLEKTEIDGSLLFYWKGKHADRPIVLMGHQDVVPAEGSWEHDPFSGFLFHLRPPLTSPKEKHQPVGEADSQSQNKLEYHPDDIVGGRETSIQKGNADGVKNAADHRGKGHADQFGIAGEAPDTVIQPQDPEQDQYEGNIDRHKPKHSHQIVSGDRAVAEIKAQQQCAKIAGHYRDGIIYHQNNCQLMPVFKSVFQNSLEQTVLLIAVPFHVSVLVMPFTGKKTICYPLNTAASKILLAFSFICSASSPIFASSS